MSAAERIPSYVTPQDYLAHERKAQTRSEYHDGVVVAMAGASWEHNQITRNLVRHLANQMDGSSCEPVVSDMRVHIPECNRYFYPDVMLVCGGPRFEDAKMDSLLNPSLIVEVLSDSTEKADRGVKFDCYRTLESLTVYALVAQDSPRVEVYTRHPDGTWRYEVVKDLEAMLALPSIGVSMRLADVYARVEFPPPTATPEAR